MNCVHNIPGFWCPKCNSIGIPLPKPDCELIEIARLENEISEHRKIQADNDSANAYLFKEDNE